ncbi:MULTISPECIES: DUF4127 family protein [Vibrio]|uniref:DUF4127 family protein n=1 Tax=Vibrio TaxID=662 RepID=UPI00237C81C4|nr:MULTISPECIES: DUF4127 family protein [Vibrio]MDE1263322.1 DUF4127 family protein [Vibrio aestuarianus]MDE1295268.1 DUF4127 family protein [Vibrio aestuarianus]MDF9401077.1 DUF4127 family protein [Vibrio sp. 1180_3]
MQLTCIPLDIRPYNYDFLESLAAMDSQVSLAIPEKAKLGFKKQAADHHYLTHYVFDNANQSDALVISLDMYIYGGLFPARVHQHEQEWLSSRINELILLKQENPKLRIYASSLVLRTPKYNSSEEEPEYYAHSGQAIFNLGFLENKQKRIGLTKEEADTLEQLRLKVNVDDMRDWTERREKNLQVTLQAIELVAKGVIEQLIVPLDDTAEFGYTAEDQVRIFESIAGYGVQDKVFVHPGTDESGCTLLTKAYLAVKEQTLQVQALYSNELFKSVVPNYEDRPFVHSLRSHSRACGVEVVEYNDPNLPMLAINGCGETMQEAFEVSYGFCVHTNVRKAKYKNVTYHTYRDLITFAKQLRERAESRPVVVADLAMSNGGETDLIKALDKVGALDKLSGYAGWNTTCNSLGTAIATLVFSTFGDNSQATSQFLKERLVSDWAYQTEVRFPVQLDYLPELGVDYGTFEQYSTPVFERVKAGIQTAWQNTIKHSFTACPPEIIAISAPFKRMSGLHIQVK